MSFFQSDGYAFDRLPDDFEVTHDCVLGLSVGKEALLSSRGIVHNVLNEGKHWGHCVALLCTLVRQWPRLPLTARIVSLTRDVRDGRGLIWFIWLVSSNQTNQTN